MRDETSEFEARCVRTRHDEISMIHYLDCEDSIALRLRHAARRLQVL